MITQSLCAPAPRVSFYISYILDQQCAAGTTAGSCRQLAATGLPCTWAMGNCTSLVPMPSPTVGRAAAVMAGALPLPRRSIDTQGRCFDERNLKPNTHFNIRVALPVRPVLPCCCAVAARQRVLPRFPGGSRCPVYGSAVRHVLAVQHPPGQVLRAARVHVAEPTTRQRRS